VAQVRFSIPGITAEQCVRTAIRGMQRKNVLIVPSALVRTGLFLQRFVPRELVIRIVARSQKRKLASDR
jgi:short-subunit dehydrogenase